MAVWCKARAKFLLLSTTSTLNACKKDESIDMSRGQAPGCYKGGEDTVWIARRTALEQLDRVADGDLARLDDAGQHSALALELGT